MEIIGKVFFFFNTNLLIYYEQCLDIYFSMSYISFYLTIKIWKIVIKLHCKGIAIKVTYSVILFV